MGVGTGTQRAGEGPVWPPGLFQMPPFPFKCVDDWALCQKGETDDTSEFKEKR